MNRPSGPLGHFQILLIAAILLLVVWALFPLSVGHGPSEPYLMSCRSQVKQLTTASMIYCADYDERLMNSNRWMDQLVPYHKNKNLERCPAVLMQFPRDQEVYGYAFHSALSEAVQSKLVLPAELVLIYDSSNLNRNASDLMTSLPVPIRSHLGASGNVMSFADGHVVIQRP